MAPEVARRIGDAAAGNRAVAEQELEKLALYLDAEPGRSVTVDHDAIAAIGAALDEGDTTQLLDALFSGNGRGVEEELSRLRSEGTEGITLIRAALRRVLLLARLRTFVEQGQRPAAVVEAQGRALFWKEKDAVAAQLGSWDAAALARALSRLQTAETEVKRSAGLGPLAADAELLAIARAAARRR